MNSSAQVPSFLATPPACGVRPPTVTNLQELPFNELTWENFEKLCLRLARGESDIEHCQLYGRRGQSQEGIDIYARLERTREYVVYQCKRVAQFGPVDLAGAVENFLSGKWGTKASTFVLCTQVSLEPRELADELEKQAGLLGSKNVSLVSWDSRQLSQKLKNCPEIVNDFFSKAWVTAFCGKEAASSLQTRLDASQVSEFRTRLGKFYTHVFNLVDPGFEGNAAADMRLLPIDQRFILPDIEEQQTVTSSFSLTPSAPDLERELRASSKFSFRTRLRAQMASRQSTKIVRRRVPADEWLASSPKHILLGGPGSGKSTLLRFVVTDLLRNQPELGVLASKWGTYLPIWIPFPAWTEKIRNRQECSLPDLVKEHLSSWAEERLWPIVESALEDERLLLVVDGLDEWVDENCAKRAADKLQVFAAQRNVPVIAASRPHGFARLGWQQSGWQTGHLAPFNRTQQKRFSKAWFRHRATALQTPEHLIDGIADRDAENFVDELAANANLRELAGIPLLLRIFIYFRFRNVALPQNRFDAYERMVTQLISEHPSNRQRAAEISPSSELDSDDIRTALGLLAFEMESRETGGVIKKQQARSILENHFKDSEHGLGLDLAASARLSKKLLEVGQNTLGVLVERTPEDLGFFHRSFQEHLAANHLSKMPFEAQMGIVKTVCSNTQWGEVILALCYMTKRPDEVRNLVETLQSYVETAPLANRYPVQRLIAEIAFGSLNCPTPLARQLAINVFEQIELGDWMPQRVSLMELTLGGLRSTALRELVRERLRAWFPCHSPYRSDLLEILGGWSRSKELLKCFWRNLHDEELRNRRTAARCISAMYYDDEETLLRILHLARHSIAEGPRIAAVEALFKGWPTREEVKPILDSIRCSLSPDFRLISILGRVALNIQTDEDCRELVRLSGITATSIWWREDIISAFLAGWPRSANVKRICLQALSENRYRYNDRMDLEIAEGVLIRGYPQDDDVVDCLIERGENNERLFLVNHFYQTANQLFRNYKGHPKLSAKIDARLKSQKDDIQHVQNAVLAMAAASPTAKEYLLNTVQRSPYAQWHAFALLEAWGMADPEVERVLIDLALGSADRSSGIAHLIPQILNKDDARIRLLELLKDPLARRVDFIMSGLQSLNKDKHDEGIVSAILAELSSRGEKFVEDAVGHVIADYGWDDRVRRIASEHAKSGKWTIRAVAAAYPNDAEFSRYVLRAASALPTELRDVIVSDPSITVSDPAFALELFGNWDTETDDAIKTEACVRYHSLKKVSGLSPEDILHLQRELAALGPDFEGRRQAAVAGLIKSGRFDLLNIAATDKKQERLMIGLTFYSNVPLVRTLLQHWDQLKEQLGERFWSILKGFESDPVQLWSRFCPFISEYEGARTDALEFLSSCTKRGEVTPEILQFLTTAAGYRSLLYEYLMEAIAINRHDREPIVGVVAAELIGQEFAGDATVKNELESKLGTADPNWDSAAWGRTLIALCEGWPNSDALARVFEHLRKSGSAPLNVWVWHLVCAKAPSESVMKNFEALLADCVNPNELWNPHMVRPLIQRLRRDDKLATIFEAQIQASSSEVMKTSLPRVLAAARGVNGVLRNWAVKEIEQQVSRDEGPAIGIDYAAGCFEPVAHSLLDVLAAAA
jgi:NACHT domain